MITLPILSMKGLLAVGGIPVSGRDGFYSVIPELALLPPLNLVGGDLGGFEGRGRVLGGPSALRRMSFRVPTDAAFISLRPLWFRRRGNILCCFWSTKSCGATFTTPLGPIVWSSTFAIRLRCRSSAGRPPRSPSDCSTTRSSRPSVPGVKVVIVFLLFVLIAVLLKHAVNNSSSSTYQGTHLSACRIINVCIVRSRSLTGPCLT